MGRFHVEPKTEREVDKMLEGEAIRKADRE